MKCVIECNDGLKRVYTCINIDLLQGGIYSAGLLAAVDNTEEAGHQQVTERQSLTERQALGHEHVEWIGTCVHHLPPPDGLKEPSPWSSRLGPVVHTCPRRVVKGIPTLRNRAARRCPNRSRAEDHTRRLRCTFGLQSSRFRSDRRSLPTRDPVDRSRSGLGHTVHRPDRSDLCCTPRR